MRSAVPLCLPAGARLVSGTCPGGSLGWQAPQACSQTHRWRRSRAPAPRNLRPTPHPLTPPTPTPEQGLCTPHEVFVAIAAEGYQVSYRRVPMSRERTPQAADLDQLLAQMGNHPAGKEVRAGLPACSAWHGVHGLDLLGLGKLRVRCRGAAGASLRPEPRQGAAQPACACAACRAPLVPRASSSALPTTPLRLLCLLCRRSCTSSCPEPPPAPRRASPPQQRPPTCSCRPSGAPRRPPPRRRRRGSALG